MVNHLVVLAAAHPDMGGVNKFVVGGGVLLLLVLLLLVVVAFGGGREHS